jgi:hypothetical protein
MVGWRARGWQVFEAEPAVAAWLECAGPEAIRASRDDGLRATWLRHGGTWFVGVDALPNGADGAVPGGPPLGGRALAEAEAVTGRLPLHRAQVSVTYPGYPARDPDESAAAHRFRRDRDAAHLDGLLPIGSGKRRFLKETHAWILGIAVSEASPDAAPLVVWEGSHRPIRAAFAEAFAGLPPENWADMDVTEIYQQRAPRGLRHLSARRASASPRTGVLVHRHAIHGVAPWGKGAKAAPGGRVIVYFRPETAAVEDWLTLP